MIHLNKMLYNLYIALKNRKNYFIIPFCNFIFICFFTFGFNSNEFKVGKWVIIHFFQNAFWMPNSIIVLFSLMLVWYRRKYNSVYEGKNSKYIFLFALIWSFVFWIGKSYFLLNNWTLFLGSLVNFLFGLSLCFCSAVSITYFVYYFYIFFYTIINRKSSSFNIDKEKIFKFSFISFLVNELFYLCAYFPGIITWDGRYQMTEFFGIRPLTNHHPIIATLIEGTIVSIGHEFHSYNFGLFIFVVLQLFFQSFTFAYTIGFLSTLTKNKYVILICYLYYLFNPILSIWGIGLGKDTIYYLSFLWLLLLLMKLLKFNYIDYKIWIQLIFSMLVLILFRKEGIFIVQLTLAFYILLFNNWKNKNQKKILCFILSFFFIFGIGYMRILKYYSIYSPRKEAFAIPFQQVARLLWNGKDIDRKDREKIDKIFGSADLKYLYNPSFADPVKGVFVDKKENYQNLKDVYFKYLLKYPASYIQAFIHQNYGYFYPYFKPIDYGYYEIPKDKILRNDILPFYTMSPLKKMQGFLKSIPEFYMGSPFLSIYYNCSFFVWLIFFVFIFSVLKKIQNLTIITIPLILTIFVCFLSPVGADTRYMLPVISSFPLWVAVVLKELHLIQ